MKNTAYLLPVLLCFGLSTGAHAQATTPRAAAPPAVAKPAHDYCMLKDGHIMMVIQGKQMTPMTTDMTMSDGSMCLTDGTCRRPDGTLLTLREGQCMLTNGKLTMHPSSVKRPSMKPQPQPQPGAKK
ncbi:MAG: hypothetical protein H7330_13460 [Hymenobacteraceae bacterium]|nr:hypothetical protein [Hymenobacteraceae bacterium]